MGAEHDRGSRPDQALRRQDRCVQPFLPGAARVRHRLPGAQRLRQVDDDADDPRPGQPHLGAGDDRRLPVPQAAERSPSGRRAAGRQGGARRSRGPQPSAELGPAVRHPGPPGGRGARRRGPPGRGAEALQGLLARHGAAARHRGRAARRPPGAAVRRARQRPRPRGHPLGPQPDEVARRGGSYGLRLLAPDERDGADRRPPDRDRARSAPRRYERAGLHRGELRGLRAGAHARHRAAVAREALHGAGRGGRPCAVRAGRRAARDGAAAAAHQRHRPRDGRTAVGAVAAPGLAGGGVHADDAGRRRLPLDHRPEGRAPAAAAARRAAADAGSGTGPAGLVRPAAAPAGRSAVRDAPGSPGTARAAVGPPQGPYGAPAAPAAAPAAPAAVPNPYAQPAPAAPAPSPAVDTTKPEDAR